MGGLNRYSGRKSKLATLVDRLDGIIDGYYGDSYDYELIRAILEEIEILNSRGILKEKNLGRLIEILQHER